MEYREIQDEMIQFTTETETMVDIIMNYEARTLEYDSNTIFVNCKRFSQPSYF